MGSLSNLYISQSYTSLIHLGSDTTITTASVELQDGLGNGIGIFVNSLGDVNIEGTISASNIPADIVSQAELNAYTASTNADLASIHTETASIESRLATIGTQSGSWGGSQVTSASYNQFTASINAYTASTNSDLTSIHSATASLFTSVTNLNSATASINSSITQLNASSASQQISIDALNTNSASVNISISALNTFTASQSTASIVTSITNLNSATASLYTSASLALVTASFNTGTRNLTFTKGDTSQFSVNIPAISSSTGDLVTTASFNAYTASNDQRVSSLEANSASVNISITNLNSFSSSQLSKDATLASYTGSNDTKWSNLGSQSGSWITESETGSFAKLDATQTFTGINTFTNEMTASAAKFLSIQTGTLTATTIHTVTESSSVIYSSGSNIFGDASTDTQTLYGSTNVVNELTASGLHYPTADNGASSFLQTDGAGNLSFQYVDSILEEVRYGENISIGDPLYVSGSNGTRPVVWRADAAVSAKMPVIYIATSTAVANTNTSALTLGNIEGVTTTGYPVGTTIYVAEGGGWSDNRPSGSSSIVQPLGIVTKEGAGGSGRGLVLNPGPVLLPNIQTGYLWVGNGTNQPVAISTGSFVTENETGSFATTGSNIFVGNQTITGSFSTNGGATFGNTSAQYNSVNIVTSKTNFPANVYNAFNINTDGDGQWSAGLYVSSYNGFGSEPAFGLYGGGTGNGGSNNVLESYGNLVRVNKNTQISGSLAVSASLTVNGSNVVVSSQTGSFITESETGSFATLLANTFNGNQTISGSFELTGSAHGNVLSASITSNTASIDFSKANYFEITSSVTPLHLNITNITPGTTSTLIISASASSSILFSPNVSQPSGSAYSGSAGSIDILSLVSFNSSKVNVVSTKAMI